MRGKLRRLERKGRRREKKECQGYTKKLEKSQEEETRKYGKRKRDKKTINK